MIKADLCVIGGGSGGLSVAAVAAQMGVNVVLIEADKMGGDCLNAGCVPSKSLLAAAKTADHIRHAIEFGIDASMPHIDYAKVSQHVFDVIAAIAPHDSVERFQSLGVRVIQEQARFLDKKTVVAGEHKITAKRFVIATGSSPSKPPIKGLAEVPYLTNETIFELAQKPAHLLVIGGGPIGCELAQAHAMLGTKVTMLELFSIMPKDDPELVDVVRTRLKKQGVVIHENIHVIQVEQTSEGISVQIKINDRPHTVSGSHLLVGAGRLPNILNMGLESAGVTFTPRGIEVDKRLRTRNKRIFAIGDAAGSFQFTHAASYHAGIVIRNALFHLPTKVNYKAMPWVTYTEPELAHVGLNEPMAQQQKIAYRVLRFTFADNDRAQAEHATEGLVKVLTTKKGQILGASIVGSHAGELIAPWVLAISQGLPISAMASAIMPYPTFAEINKRVAGEFYLPKLYSKTMHRIVRLLGIF